MRSPPGKVAGEGDTKKFSVSGEGKLSFYDIFFTTRTNLYMYVEIEFKLCGINTNYVYGNQLCSYRNEYKLSIDTSYCTNNRECHFPCLHSQNTQAIISNFVSVINLTIHNTI